MTKEQIIKILKKYELSDDGDIIIYTTEINAFADAILALPIEGETDKEQADELKPAELLKPEACNHPVEDVEIIDINEGRYFCHKCNKPIHVKVPKDGN